MADTLTPAQRHKCMQAIRSKNTKPEQTLRKEFRKANLKFKSNYKRVEGTPDFVFVEEKVAVFCDSEFFHGKNWKKEKYRIKTNRKFWWNKIEKNIARDKKVTKDLKKSGWKVIRIWSNDLKRKKESCADRILNIIKERQK